MSLGGAFLFRQLSVAVLLATVLATGASAETRVKGKYSLSISGIKVGDLRFTGTIHAGRYELEGSGKIAGLPQFFTSFTGETASEGSITEDGITPKRHSIGYNTVKKDYETRIIFRERSVSGLDLEPPYKSKKSRVPVLEEHMTSVIDPLSAAVIPIPGDGPLLGPDVCDRTLSIFDGRERFDLSLTHKGLGQVSAREEGGYSGPVAICRVAYTPIAGHRRNDRYVERLASSDDIEIWFAPVEAERVLMFYRAAVPTPYGAAVIHPKAFVITAISPQG